MLSKLGQIANRYSLKAKLISSLSLILFTLMISLGVSQRTISSLTHAVYNLSSSATASDWLAQSSASKSELLQYVWTATASHEKGKAASEGSVKDILSTADNFSDSIKKFSVEIQLDEKEKTLYQKLDASWTTIFPKIKDFCEKTKTGSLTKDELIKLAGQLTEESLALGDTISELSGIQKQKGTEASSYATLLGRQNMILSILVLFVSIMSGAIAVGFVFRLSATISKLTERLSSGAEDVNSASRQVLSSSDTLAASVTEQAAALQETSATVEELSAMVQKNADNAAKSQEISTESVEVANKGKTAVDETIRAIEEIDKSNSEIATEMESNNRDIANIVKVIAEIGDKTKIINDIVFQTKLLSFNASVEAARAGESGKGFAVVAEEVGNLARMSGTAAKEISDMLSASIVRVEEIAAKTKGKVESLVQTGKKKVEQGIKVAKSCGTILDQAVSNVEQVSSMVKEVAVASNEQAKGIAELAKALTEMEKVNQQNSTAAQHTASASTQLTSQAENQRSTVNDLHSVVHGSAATNATDIKSA